MTYPKVPFPVVSLDADGNAAQGLPEILAGVHMQDILNAAGYQVSMLSCRAVPPYEWVFRLTEHMNMEVTVNLGAGEVCPQCGAYQLRTIGSTEESHLTNCPRYRAKS